MKKLSWRSLALWSLAGVLPLLLLSACDGGKLEWPKNLGMSWSPVDALAQTNGFRYSVNFVCGFSPSGLQDPVVPGYYQVLFNIRNPSTSPIAVTMRAAPSVPPGSLKSGRLSGFLTKNIDSLRSIAVDCETIVSDVLEESSTSFSSGILEIFSSTRVVVFATYTAGELNEVKSIFVERVPAG